MVHRRFRTAGGRRPFLVLCALAVLCCDAEPGAQVPPSKSPVIATAPVQEPSVFADLAEAKARSVRDGRVPLILGLPLEADEPEWTRRQVQNPEIRERLATEQQALLDFLTATDREVVRHAYRFQVLPYLAVALDERGIEELESLWIDSVFTSVTLGQTMRTSALTAPYPYSLETALSRIGMPEPPVHSPEAPVTVVVVDNGVDPTASFLADRLVGGGYFASDPNGSDVVSTDKSGPGPGAPWAGLGEMSHGTHVAALLAGSSPAAAELVELTQGAADPEQSQDSEVSEELALATVPDLPAVRGVAPRANVVTLRVASYVDGVEKIWNVDIVKALAHVYEDYVLDEEGEAVNLDRVVAVNISLRGKLYKDEQTCDKKNGPTAKIVKLLLDEGVAVIVASGNGGSTKGLSYPACLEDVVAVGATYPDITDTAWGYSNSAERLDLYAPGVGINAEELTGADVDLSGTSFAAPFVTGAWAILNERFPGRSFHEYLKALQSPKQGVPVVFRKDVGRNMLNIAEALDELGP